jgi:hypothetical protein
MNARGEQKRAVTGSGTASHTCLALYFLCVAAFIVRSAIIALPGRTFGAAEKRVTRRTRR